jgi:hypothetical protein
MSMQRPFALGCAALAMAACTVDNPLYTPLSFADLAGTDRQVSPFDLAGVTGDLATPACMPGERACSATASDACVNGTFVAERVCPVGAVPVCAAGHCLAPPAMAGAVIGKPCTVGGKPSEAFCVGGGTAVNQPSCEPFVDPSNDKVIDWLCAPRVGTGVPATPCTSGSTCRSGYCGNNGTCFRSCVTVADCPSQTTVTTWNCAPVMIEVEGLSVTANSCIPG